MVLGMCVLQSRDNMDIDRAMTNMRQPSWGISKTHFLRGGVNHCRRRCILSHLPMRRPVRLDILVL